MAQTIYEPRTFNLAGLNGISDETVEMHLGLYEGYVSNTNRLNLELREIARQGDASGRNLEYAELTRRLGFEYGGMVLHEYYFDNLAGAGRGQPSNALEAVLADSFGGFENWKQSFVAVGGMRGVGWAILYQDPRTGRLSNHWIAEHQDGVPSGFKPILVMDVWEHAFILDHGTAKAKYIDSFFSNIDWETVNERVESPAAICG